MDEDENILTGETIELPDDEDDSVIDTEDGGAIVRLDEEEGEERSDGFYANLAETMSETELSEIARTYLDMVAKDKEARKKRDEQYEEGIRRTGLGDDAPGGAQFQGATKGRAPDADRGLRRLRCSGDQGAGPA